MSSEESFMEAILQSPDDDTLRLIFADWLEERGDPRGEFIRVQYALMDEKLDERKRFELKTREQELIVEHGRKWAGAIHDLVQGYRFRRGMMEEVTLDPESLQLHAKLKVLFTNRLIRSLVVRVRNPPPGNFLFPSLTGLEELDLSLNHLGDGGLFLLTQCSQLKLLRSLRLNSNAICLNGTRTLASSTAFPALRRLSMSFNPIEDLGFQALCASKTLTQLTALAVEACGIGVDALRGASKDFRLLNLEELNLGYNPMPRHGLAALLRIPFAKPLRTLGLGNARLDSTAIQPLLDSPKLAGLKALDLRNNLLTDLAAKNLAASPHLTALQHLYLEGNNIGPAGREKLKARFGDAVSF